MREREGVMVTLCTKENGTKQLWQEKRNFRVSIDF